jgi:hypothetical protein
MTRDNIICFRTSEELRKALERISRSERRSLSSTIENILYVYLEQREPKMPREDKRRYPRKKISSPALVSTRDGEIHAGTVHDMSLGGVNILLPPTFQCEIGDDSRLYVVFTLPESTRPVNIECIPRYLRAGDQASIGASFTNTDFQCYQALRNHLTQ